MQNIIELFRVLETYGFRRLKDLTLSLIDLERFFLAHLKSEREFY